MLPVAGDLLWYPVRGSLRRQAPDVMVVFGRPKGDRRSYKQWEENNIPPQVVFEILSPGNTVPEMGKKLLFYHRYGVEEYYIYNPDTVELSGFLRQGDWLEPVEQMNGWVSPLLGIRFGFNPVSGIQLAKNHPLLPPAEIIVAFIWADLHNGDAPSRYTAPTVSAF